MQVDGPTHSLADRESFATAFGVSPTDSDTKDMSLCMTFSTGLSDSREQSSLTSKEAIGTILVGPV